MIFVFAVNIFVIALTVMIHYEFLHQITLWMPRMKIRHRLRIVIGVFVGLTAHAAEVWIFALSFFLMHRAEGWGYLDGNFNGTFMDCVYFSFTSYTTLGTGDIVPHGDLRYLTGLESLVGLVLITWSASFLYLEMTRYWDDD
ncbi:MAG: two pore domain potassium channel family protein [Gammaproteobacteria bacterium]|nr:MAG: two pore domain potassium channel family protein [Gammaproteobacteria bacterium]RLA60052.1 MAG: two pore domain potassium channel family protein [Gammaproteobacteria bacterium]